MKTVIFSTNLPSPYRVDFFNELGKYCDLTVLYERYTSTERNIAWKGTQALNFKEVYLDLKLSGVDRAKGSALKNYIKTHKSNILIFTNYVSPATQFAIMWCRLHGRKYYMEYDGGFFKKDSIVNRCVKKFLLKGAIGHLTTANQHIEYLVSLGIDHNLIYKYPFSSIKEDDIKRGQNDGLKGKQYYRQLLRIKEEKVVIAVGQFIYRKGFDILLKASSLLDNSVGVYIIGGEPTEEYLSLKKSLHLKNVHFIGFKTKEELSLYYQAADCTAFPTREDIWGLVTNESLAYGVPVVATDKCISAIEMITNGIEGYIVQAGNVKQLASGISKVISVSMYDNSIAKAKEYTIEAMVRAHRKYFSLS